RDLDADDTAVGVPNEARRRRVVVDLHVLGIALRRLLQTDEQSAARTGEGANGFSALELGMLGADPGLLLDVAPRADPFEHRARLLGPGMRHGLRHHAA